VTVRAHLIRDQTHSRGPRGVLLPGRLRRSRATADEAPAATWFTVCVRTWRASFGEGAVDQERDEIVVYWRPDCMFCLDLLLRLKFTRLRYRKVNIQKDPRARAFVRSVADGNETRADRGSGGPGAGEPIEAAADRGGTGTRAARARHLALNGSGSEAAHPASALSARASHIAMYSADAASLDNVAIRDFIRPHEAVGARMMCLRRYWPFQVNERPVVSAPSRM
jgi:hypothetical protein